MLKPAHQIIGSEIRKIIKLNADSWPIISIDVIAAARPNAVAIFSPPAAIAAIRLGLRVVSSL